MLKYIFYIEHGYPNNEIKASENHVGVKSEVKLGSLACSTLRNVL